MATSKNLPLPGIVLTFLGAVLFSTKAIIVKLAFRNEQVDVITLLALRMLFSLPFFLGVAIWTRDAAVKPMTARQWVLVSVIGMMGYYISSWFDFIGLQFISAGLERLILFLYPSFVALINMVFFRQRLSRMQKWALLCTYLGIGMAYYGELLLDFGNPNFLFGSMMVFFCSITYAIYLAGSGRLIPQVGSTRFTAYAMLAATTGVLLHFFFTHEVGDLQLKAGMWKYGLLLAIIATVLPAFLMNAGLKQIGSNNAAIVSSIGPVSTIAQAYLFLGETMHIGQIAGTVLVIIGVLLIGWKGRQASGG
ncbi:DMT family transporter [Flavihumibacter solisilvae]|uniref:EamA domain-containing protein n=1 Tax=Flavihumibacter solisilvae TaxID=1349421 RepID=A0A0C1IJ00_9BACT|nr:DMT family transporter [Flavihumibacter solisilvae]KIC94180.1 hypothetical protein OI18_14495 [Flavihumibacter solisilvae]